VITQSKRYNSFLFEAVDNILDMESFSNFLPEFGEKKLDINLFYEVKSNLNKEQVRILRKSGVICIQPGIESLNTEVLELMRNCVTAIQNIQVWKFCREMEIQVTWSILFGFPGERRHHYEETLATIPFLTHLFPPSAVPRIVVQRFSPYHFDAERLGIRNVKPPAMYGHIYPENKVNLNNLAYFFDYTLDESQEDPATYIKPVKSAVNRWKRAFHVDKVSFTYRLGPGFIELQDTRPLESSSRLSKPRRTILRGVERDDYLLCVSIRSFKDICNLVSEKTGGEWTTDRTRELLDRMLADKLMFSEKDRFLSLATAARPRTSPANGSHDNIRNGNGHQGPVKIVKIDQSVSEIDRARSE
jgi:ribosomal peptide maturation radical SAM protein 1